MQPPARRLSPPPFWLHHHQPAAAVVAVFIDDETCPIWTMVLVPRIVIIRPHRNSMICQNTMRHYTTRNRIRQDCYVQWTYAQ